MLLTRRLISNCRNRSNSYLRMSVSALDRIIANNKIAEDALAALKREVNKKLKKFI